MSAHSAAAHAGDAEGDLRSPTSLRAAALRHAVAHAAHLLPAQAPLHAFVHHNTLHAFEDLPFEAALEKAAEVFGAEPYPTEAALARYMQEGSIELADIVAVVEEAFPGADETLGALGFRDFVVQRLLRPVETVSEEAVRFLVSEDLVTSRFSAAVSPARRAELEAFAAARAPGSDSVPRLLEELWRTARGGVPERILARRVGPRRRDQLFYLVGEDADSLSMPHLIRLAASYLDQGVSYFPMPERQRGFLHCFRELYKRPFGVMEKWLLPLAKELARQEREGYDAETTCLWALDELGVQSSGFPRYVEAALLSLSGFAGMFATVEASPEKCPVEAPPARLLDFLAVALTLEVYAARYVQKARAAELEAWLPAHAPLSELDRAVLARGAARASHGPDLALAYEAFVLLQGMPVALGPILDDGKFPVWLEWVKRTSELTRRRLLWQALERHHLDALTHGLAEHARWLETRALPEPKIQAVFCIDDREESYRRHLEEVEPGFSTYAYPGFFGIAMRYHALGEVRSRDLCPVVVKATHVVREVPAGEAERRAGRFRPLVPHRNLGTSTTLVRGFLTSALGVLSIVPLVLAVLFPRWFHERRKKATAVRSDLLFARQEPAECGEAEHDHAHGGLPEGYSDEEMVELVGRLLGDIGLVKDFCPIVLVIGHGASSVNNPLVAAYGCGATAGGCGGPNARVWCAMANRPSVRAALRSRGIDIPDGTVFVGGMHDTTTDDVTLYPSQEITGLARERLELAQRSLDEASKRNAHERCRLFLQVPTDITSDQAKAIVESRSADLSAARPEFNHAKNSCAIVGRRKFTRGLFMDKRAFLVSSDPTTDHNGEGLERQIMGSVPVGMGINLEYFFATVDNQKYGSGSKLPHNVTGLVGIMNGHASDLQTGLNSQMVEPHEPIRLVAVVEAEPAELLALAERRPNLKRLILGGWIQVVAWLPERHELYHFKNGEFRRLTPSAAKLPTYERSVDAYEGKRHPLALSHIEASLEVRA